jgi:DNA-binding response OmpR family regulator
VSKLLLVIDDDPVERTILGRVLVGAGFRVMTAAALKRGPALTRCPILMLTAKDETTDRFWAGEGGADAFLTRPADIPLLLQTIAELADRA